jgi:hypothetical protein
MIPPRSCSATQPLTIHAWLARGACFQRVAPAFKRRALVALLIVDPGESCATPRRVDDRLRELRHAQLPSQQRGDVVAGSDVARGMEKQVDLDALERWRKWPAGDKLNEFASSLLSCWL